MTKKVERGCKPTESRYKGGATPPLPRGAREMYVPYYKVKPTTVEGSSQQFRKVVEIPEEAQNVRFYTKPEKLSKKYQSALQDVSWS